MTYHTIKACFQMPEDAVSSGSNARRARRSPSSNGVEPPTDINQGKTTQKKRPSLRKRASGIWETRPEAIGRRMYFHRTRLQICRPAGGQSRILEDASGGKGAAVLRGISHIKPQKREAPLRGTLPSFAHMAHQILVMFFSFSIFTKAYSPRSPRVCTSAQSPLTLQICTRPLFFSA